MTLDLHNMQIGIGKSFMALPQKYVNKKMLGQLVTPSKLLKIGQRVIQPSTFKIPKNSAKKDFPINY
jgi:hypothetical protein